MTKPTEQEKDDARKEFYRIITTRLDSRIEKGEVYTTTKDLYKGYEALHEKGFGRSIPPSQSVSAVLGYARYRDRLFYARHVVSQAPERSLGDRRSPYRVYLRADAPVPKDHVLVPIAARGAEIGEYIAAARGVADAGVHVTLETQPEPCETVYATQLVDEPPVTPHALSIDDIVERLTSVIRAQAEIIDGILPMLNAITGHGHGDGHLAL